jgi:1-acyl-sn-glycerol-3-phosphate acyltransferase
MIGATLAGFERAPAWLRAARRARLGAALAAGLLVLLPTRLLTRRAAPDRPSWSGVAFLRLLLWGLRIRVTVEGALAPRALVVANHLSWTDILVLGASRPTALLPNQKCAAGRCSACLPVCMERCSWSAGAAARQPCR